MHTLFLRTQLRCGSQSGLTAERFDEIDFPDAEAQGQRGRAGSTAEKQGIGRGLQGVRKLLEQGSVRAFQPDEENSVGKVVTAGDVGRFLEFLLFLERRQIAGCVKVDEEASRTVRANAEAQLIQRRKPFRRIAAYSQSRGQQADHTAFVGARAIFRVSKLEAMPHACMGAARRSSKVGIIPPRFR